MQRVIYKNKYIKLNIDECNYLTKLKIMNWCDKDTETLTIFYTENLINCY